MNSVEEINLIINVLTLTITLLSGIIIPIFIHKSSKAHQSKLSEIKIKQEELKRNREKNIKIEEFKKGLELPFNFILDMEKNEFTLFSNVFDNKDKLLNNIIESLSEEEEIEFRKLYTQCKNDYNNLFDYNEKNRNGSNQIFNDIEFIKLRKKSAESIKKLFNF